MLVAVLLVVLAVLGTGTRVLGRDAVMLGGGCVIAVRFVHPCRQVMGMGLRVRIGVAVLVEKHEDREGKRQVAAVDVRLGGFQVALQVFGARLAVDVRALTVSLVMVLGRFAVVLLGARVLGRGPVPLTRRLVVAQGRVTVRHL